MEAVLQSRELWNQSYEALLKFASTGIFEKEVLKAKEDFFGRLGRTHELVEDLYETSSQTFLEWYLFDCKTRQFQKSPAVVYASLQFDSELRTKVIESSLFNHWSLFQVKVVKPKWVEVEDLLIADERTGKKKRRRLFRSDSWPEYRSWKILENQIFQARLFPLSDTPYLFATHLWLQPQKETERLLKITDRQRKSWGLHQDFLISCFEACIRSFGLESQLTASRASNWYYQELNKKYA